ncbi:MAG: hypothetical protein J7L83_04340 [Thaumarchaeota archaeon]|nr:hypothetical protein [Nitrososphaerota archaeon]
MISVEYDVFVKFIDGGEAYCGSFDYLPSALDFVKQLNKTFLIYSDIGLIQEYVIQPRMEAESDEGDED